MTAPIPMLTCRHFYDTAVEEAVNLQIKNELSASYIYLAMANYFGRPEVSLPGATAFFAGQSKEETEHAQKLIDYQNSRGGKVRLQPILAPARQDWPDLRSAFVDALALEQKNNTALIQLHKMAGEKSDADLTNFLEEFYLRVQVEEIQMMARHCNSLARMGGKGLGEHLFDRELLKQLTKSGGVNKRGDRDSDDDED